LITKDLLEAKTEHAIHGDKAAFEEIYAAKRRELYIVALTMLGSKEDAEDAVQETMLGMFRNIGNLRNPKAFNGWVHKILHDNCVNIIRKKERRISTVLLSEAIVDTVADADSDVEPEQILGKLEICAELYEAIRSLPEKSREALLLYYFSDMKYKEIAKATGSSIKTVSTNLIRAKKNLKAFLQEYYPDTASLAVLLPMLKIAMLAPAAGGGAALAGAKISGGVLFGKNILASLSNLAIPAATGTAGVAGVACVATIAYAILAPPGYEIALTGDCGCGHINPHHIELKGARAGDNLSAWEAIAEDGAILHTGDLPSITKYIKKLEDAHKHGHYTLRCEVTGKDGARYALSRDITIGNLAGDA
jgi:RNA polymerase sigma-70 factor (ECF subfamily)